MELIDVGYHDPVDPADEVPTQEDEDRERERWEHRRVRRHPPVDPVGYRPGAS